MPSIALPARVDRFDFSGDFHVYAVEWDEQELRFFVDDVHHATVGDADTDGFLGSQTAPAEVHLNVAVGGDYVGKAQPDATSVWPQRLLVDFVRVYEREAKPTSPRISRRQGSDANSGQKQRQLSPELPCSAP